jgi:hypothetical protein
MSTQGIPFRLTVRKEDRIETAHEGTMLPFQIAPRVVLWGSRVFMIDEGCPRVDRLEYVEVFFVAVP